MNTRDRTAENRRKDKLYTGVLFEPLFSRLHPTWLRNVIKLVLIGGLAMILGLGIGWGIQAVAVPVEHQRSERGAAQVEEEIAPPYSTTEYDTLAAAAAARDVGTEDEDIMRVRCPNSMPPISRASCWAHHKFDRHRMGHSGYRPVALWRNPGEVRDATIRKMRNKMDSLRTTPGYAWVEQRTAAQWYASLSNSTSDCVGGDDGFQSYQPYSSGFSFCNYDYNDNGPGDTKEGLQKIGSVVFCGGTVFAAWWTAGASMAITAWSGLSCGWGAWITFDD